MKNLKTILLAAYIVTCVGMMTWSAVTEARSWLSETGAVALTTQHTASEWTIIDSAIVITSDSANTIAEFSGIAVLDPGDVLYLGFTNDSAGYAVPLDTLIIEGITFSRGQTRVPFTVRHVFDTTAAVTDTIFVLGAVGGGGIGEAVALEDALLTAHVTGYGY